MSKKPRKTIKYEEIKELDIDTILKMNKKELTSLLDKIRVKTETRIKQFNKYKSVYSPARVKLEENLKNLSDKKQTRNVIIHEILAHQAFHQAKTSTVEGARKVASQQDAMLFGVGKDGRPKHRMRSGTRTRFWSLYDEFLRTYENSMARFGYQAIWQELAEMQVEGKIRSKKGEINTKDLEELLNRLEKKEEKENAEYEYANANVYSGKGFT